MRSRLCIIPCGSSKIWDKNPQVGPVQARDVYTGIFAVTCQRYAQTFFNSWVILSAKYGFLFPDDVVEGAYNVSFNNPTNETIKIETLIEQARDKGLDLFEEIVVLGGKNYSDRTKQVFINGQEIILPLSDCKGIGYMLQKLSHALEQGKEIDLSTTLEGKAQVKNNKATISNRTSEETIVKKHNGKYAALQEYLINNEGYEITLTLDEIEEILGCSLPDSARKHRPWWANTRSHSHANSWIDAGYEVTEVNMPTSIKFIKR